MTQQIASIARAITSGSNFFRRRLCPGSHREEAKYAPEPDNEYSEEGKLLHSLFYTGERPDTLTMPQQEVLTLADSYTERFIDRVQTIEGIGEAEFETDREVSLSFRKGNAVLFPGHADLIITWPSKSVRAVIDAKFGMLEVDDAPNNDQLVIYAIQAGQVAPVNRTHVALVQPRNFGPRLTEAAYSLGRLHDAAADALRVWNAAQAGDAPLIAGEKQCHFCRAKARCPAFAQKFGQIEVARLMAIESCSDDQLIRLHEGCSLAYKIREQVSGELRRRIERQQITEYALGNSGDERTVKDAGMFYQVFKAVFGDLPGWSAARFDACREISWGKLETYVRELTGFSEKKAKERVREIADPFCTITPKAKRIVRAT